MDALTKIEAGSLSDHTGAHALTREDSDLMGGPVDRLFRSQAPRLFRFLLRRTAQREDAADLLQETFLRLVRMAAVETLPISPEAYLQRIASNLLRDRARRRIIRSDDLHVPLDDQILPDCRPGPGTVLEMQDLVNQYEAALAKLRPKTREIFLLHRRDGLTYAQIAAEAGLSVSGVEKHMMKAIAHIDRVFGRI